jgi:N-acetylmuramic acid 6-phosphate (MurNAc-6-P) etherase
VETAHHDRRLEGLATAWDASRADLDLRSTDATAASPERVDATLDLAGGDAKVAIVMLLDRVDASTARVRLEQAGGVVRGAPGR